jgi:hypothetical protein
VSAALALARVQLDPDHPIRRAEDAGISRNVGGWVVRHDGREFSVLRSRDNIAADGGPPDWRWHISVAGRDLRPPPWELLVAVGHQLRPGVVFVVGVPPRSWWINEHPGCLHLWEMRDPALEAQWREEGRGDQPS